MAKCYSTLLANEHERAENFGQYLILSQKKKADCLGSGLESNCPRIAPKMPLDQQLNSIGKVSRLIRW